MEIISKFLDVVGEISSESLLPAAAVGIGLGIIGSIALSILYEEK